MCADIHMAYTVVESTAGFWLGSERNLCVSEGEQSGQQGHGLGMWRKNGGMSSGLEVGKRVHAGNREGLIIQD